MANFEFIFSVDYYSYVSEYLMAIKKTNGDMYNMITIKNSKVLCYNFNDCLNKRGEAV